MGLQLLTPKAHHFLNSTFANMPAQQRGEGRPTLHMHPDDARARALSDGSGTLISNERGTLRGMHFQRDPHGEAKLVTCLSGAMYDVFPLIWPACVRCTLVTAHAMQKSITFTVPS